MVRLAFARLVPHPALPSPSRLVLRPSRAFHSTPFALAPKPPVALISKIRSLRPGTPLTLARSALVASKNDLDGALKWIADQAAESGAAKAKKLEGRAAEEGLVGVALLADGTGGVGVRGAMVELSCETDFVARTDEFRELLESVTRSLAFFAEPPPPSSSTSSVQFTSHTPSSIADIPILPPPSASSLPTPLVEGPLPTIGTSIATTISRLGENISLRRATSVAVEPVLPGSTLHFTSSYLHGSRAATTGPSYLHGSSKAHTTPAGDFSFQSGTLASLLLFRLPPGGTVDKTNLKAFARALARQVVAIPTSTVRPVGREEGVGEGEQSKALYEQPLITLGSTEELEFEPGTNVEGVVKRWSQKAGVEGEGLEVIEVRRWEVGGADEA